jgi:hypothetical protein
VDETSTISRKEAFELNGINLTLLSEKIEQSGMKRKIIAEKMNLTPEGLRNKLNGKRDFNAKEIKGIAHAINLTGDDILSIFFADVVGKVSTR